MTMIKDLSLIIFSLQLGGAGYGLQPGLEEGQRELVPLLEGLRQAGRRPGLLGLAQGAHVGLPLREDLQENVKIIQILHAKNIPQMRNLIAKKKIPQNFILIVVNGCNITMILVKFVM